MKKETELKIDKYRNDAIQRYDKMVNAPIRTDIMASIANIAKGQIEGVEYVLNLLRGEKEGVIDLSKEKERGIWSVPGEVNEILDGDTKEEEKEGEEKK